MGSVLPGRERGSLVAGAGAGEFLGQDWRLAFLEPPPSGDYTVRVKLAPFRSCSPRVTFRAELSGQGVGCVRRLALPAPASTWGQLQAQGGSPHPGSQVGPTLTLLPQGLSAVLPEAWA